MLAISASTVTIILAIGFTFPPVCRVYSPKFWIYTETLASYRLFTEYPYLQALQAQASKDTLPFIQGLGLAFSSLYCYACDGNIKENGVVGFPPSLEVDSKRVKSYIDKIRPDKIGKKKYFGR